MGKILAILFSIMLTNLSFSYAQSCNDYGFSSNATYTKCVTLPVLNSHLHWNYTNGTVDMAFRHTGSTTNQWVAWALNINASGMIGAQALVALTSSDGSVQAYTSAVTSNNTSLQPSSLSFQVPMIRSERLNESVVIYATLVLPRGNTIFNQTWQVGPATNGVPTIHELGSDNLNSVGSVDFSNVGRSRTGLKKTHGVLIAVSGALLLPLGAITGRYIRLSKGADSAWFNFVHVVCQTSGYIVYFVGWVIGLKLDSDSVGNNRNIGNATFALSTIQVLAWLLKPKEQPKRRWWNIFYRSKQPRTCWNIFHHSLGYLVIIMSIVNNYKGVDKSDLEKKSRHAFTGLIIAFGIITLLLETLIRCCKKN